MSLLLVAGLDFLANTLGDGRTASRLQTGLHISRSAELLATWDLVHKVPLLLSPQEKQALKNSAYMSGPSPRPQ